MKINNRMRIYILAAMLLCLCSLSCKKNELEKDDIIAYVAQNLSAYRVIPTNTTDTIISNMDLIYAGKTNVGFPALLVEPSNSDVEITSRIDNNPELIAAYDSLYHSHSPTIPDGLFKINGNGKISIKAGEKQSADSIKIKIDKISGLKTGKFTYMVPIVMECTAKNVKLKSRLMFVRYNIFVSNLEASISDYYGSSNIILMNDQNLNGSVFFIQASLNNTFRQAIEVGVEEISNKEFLDTYNSEHHTSYLPFPKGAYVLLRSAATVPAEETISSEDIEGRISDASVFSSSQAYLLPLKVKENGVGSLAGGKNNIMYISVEKNNLDRDNAVLNGERIDRKNWIINARGHYGTFVPENILDGNNATAWDSDGRLPQWLTLDMGTVQIVKGFSIVPNYDYPDDDFISMDVFSSNDGINWKIEGKYTGTPTSTQSSAANPDIKTVNFISPVTARYFKFNITKTTEGSYAGMAELYGIK